MRLVDLDTKVTTWNYDFDKQEYVAVQTTVGEMIDLNTHEGLSIPIFEIPEPHGRLIDADRLKESLNSYILNTQCHYKLTEALVWVRNELLDKAPTVIPASEEE